MRKGQKPVSQICKENGIRDSLAYRFRDEALDGMKSEISGSQKRGTLGAEAEKDRLLKIIGQWRYHHSCEIPNNGIHRARR